ncbi:unnamed protein product [Spirodela intermedia]|uniref:Uncharacterized protein n=2 Tax=Spirodela intermedia TaxID=51605 RepID=A0A7I8JFJ9_SPIIN|nr:unnamed protein product [Spirodela intermedia]CAA6668936.1 unnamed protein product [Spirodela intermedia]CAA7405871.1 unnamed protein product [Spirodela intermedia]
MMRFFPRTLAHWMRSSEELTSSNRLWHHGICCWQHNVLGCNRSLTKN